MKYASLDIDGPISKYPKCWINYININSLTNFTSKEEAKTKLGLKRYKKLKHNYRLSDYKANLQINEGIYKVIKKLKECEFSILLMTSRPFSDYPNLFNNTKNWLVKNQISFDAISQKNEKNIDKYSNIYFHVDDELRQCDLYLRKNIPCYIINSNEEIKKTKLITPINDVTDLIQYIY